MSSSRERASLWHEDVTVFNRLIVKPPSFQDNWSITEQLHRGLKRGVGSIHYRKWLASRSYLEEATNTRYTARSFIHYNAVNTLKKFARCRNRDEISRLRLLDAVASLPPRVHHVNWSGKNYRRHRHSWRAAPRRHFGCIRSKSSDAIVHLSTDLIIRSSEYNAESFRRYTCSQWQKEERERIIWNF